ncbi:hypothetical protein PILCRDRAFT_820001 [Piloderma croceum F 1598]|uniref:Uncharacterized protein n=1 Tax=Piloderma croceum (strain F 1598) TaxID=765440 RepID=A0A0C3FSQ9_PILCF|nr:hypothetical protein PILCRDRAFT_820001 [Piloderma croceum F 1598]
MISSREEGARPGAEELNDTRKLKLRKPYYDIASAFYLSPILLVDSSPLPITHMLLNNNRDDTRSNA